MGVILGSAIVPIALCVTWSKANKWGCIIGAVSGFFACIIAWLVTTSALNDKVINVTVSPEPLASLFRSLECLRDAGLLLQTSGGEFRDTGLISVVFNIPTSMARMPHSSTPNYVELDHMYFILLINHFFAILSA